MEWGCLLPGGIPTSQVKMPRLPNARDRRLVGDEEARLLEGCLESQATWLYPAVVLAMETAMRAAELLGLRWEHIDLKGRVAVLPDTKNGTARRVPLSSRPSRRWNPCRATSTAGFFRRPTERWLRTSRLPASVETLKGCASTISATRPPAAFSRKASTPWKYRPSRATRRCKC